MFIKREGINELLHGAVDMHVHAYPEIHFDCELRLTDLETLQMAKDYGMRGIVFKSHMWPTMASVYQMQQRISGIEAYPSIALNVSSGGINAWAVESAAEQGARVVWMPTWSTKNDIRNGGFYKHMQEVLHRTTDFKEEDGLYILDEHGKVTQNVREVIEIVKQYDLPLFTGHLSPPESLALMRACNEKGLKKVVMDHPDSYSIRATQEQVEEMARLGGFIEFVALGTLPAQQRIHPRKIAEIIKRVGADHVILDTDCFFDYPCPAPEMLRMLVASLLHFGITPEEIIQMVRTNPYYLLNIPQDAPMPAENPQP